MLKSRHKAKGYFKARQGDALAALVEIVRQHKRDAKQAKEPKS